MVDAAQSPVVLVQVENEIGMIPTARDRSAEPLFPELHRVGEALREARHAVVYPGDDPVPAGRGLIRGPPRK